MACLKKDNTPSHPNLAKENESDRNWKSSCTVTMLLRQLMQNSQTLEHKQLTSANDNKTSSMDTKKGQLKFLENGARKDTFVDILWWPIACHGKTNGFKQNSTKEVWVHHICGIVHQPNVTKPSNLCRQCTEALADTKHLGIDTTHSAGLLNDEEGMMPLFVSKCTLMKRTTARRVSCTSRASSWNPSQCLHPSWSNHTFPLWAFKHTKTTARFFVLFPETSWTCPSQWMQYFWLVEGMKRHSHIAAGILCFVKVKPMSAIWVFFHLWSETEGFCCRVALRCCFKASMLPLFSAPNSIGTSFESGEAMLDCCCCNCNGATTFTWLCVMQCMHTKWGSASSLFLAPSLIGRHGWQTEAPTKCLRTRFDPMDSRMTQQWAPRTKMLPLNFLLFTIKSIQQVNIQPF